MLDARLVKHFGAFRLDATVRAPAGTTLVLVGESGAGKTTVLRLLAGLDTPDDGRIVLEDSAWFDREARLALPAARRDVGYVAQDYALFPHLDVFDNVAFGLRAQGRNGAAMRSRVEATLGQFGVSALAARRPAQLSGGQQQRVALARALVLDPSLLLLDEPLSALDLQTRRAVRSELRRLLATLPCVTVYVTHTPSEALLFGDQITVLENGMVTQTGSRDDLLRHPRSPYVAEFMGVNLFRGTIVERTREGLARLATDGRDLWIVDPGTGDELFAAVSPREITLHSAPPAGSAQNLLSGPVVEMVPEPPLGERLRVALGTSPPLVAEITRHAASELGLADGAMVYATFKATGVVVYGG
ncbi:MAG TPA: ABC transporter ATP-binding protein [Candidatus Limnocylindria bacterium]|nr:ABC transporter ATP-binding protein [Candidatus Limnocylindria bacterium]